MTGFLTQDCCRTTAFARASPSRGAATCTNRWQLRHGAYGKRRNCLHQGAPRPRFLLEPMATGRTSRWRWIRRQPQFGDQPQNLGEQHSWHGDLGHLERNVASVADDLRADLDKLLLQAGQGPVLDWLGRRECRADCRTPRAARLGATGWSRRSRRGDRVRPDATRPWPLRGAPFSSYLEHGGRPNITGVGQQARRVPVTAWLGGPVLHPRRAIIDSILPFLSV